jgi:nitroreductase
MLRDLILKNRTYRRFNQQEKISMETLRELIDLARLSSSGANLQPLKYILSNDKKTNELIFRNLKWAGYLKDWDGPKEGERPSAYIVMMGDKNISTNYWWDHGIAAQSILLGATEKGFGGCQFGAFSEKGLKKDLDIPKSYKILAVIALGKPKEKVILEKVNEHGDIKYWRDEEGIHHVPKRALKDIILKEYKK